MVRVFYKFMYYLMSPLTKGKTGGEAVNGNTTEIMGASMYNVSRFL